MRKTTKKPSAAVLLRQRIERHDVASSELAHAARNFVAASTQNAEEYARRCLLRVAREYAAAVRALARVNP